MTTLFTVCGTPCAVPRQSELRPSIGAFCGNLNFARLLSLQVLCAAHKVYTRTKRDASIYHYTLLVIIVAGGNKFMEPTVGGRVLCFQPSWFESTLPFLLAGDASFFLCPSGTFRFMFSSGTASLQHRDYCLPAGSLEQVVRFTFYQINCRADHFVHFADHKPTDAVMESLF